MSIRSWVTLGTFVLIALVVVLGWPEIERAWGLLDKFNIWILMLLVPLQLLGYFAVGEIIFSYLRSKEDLKGVSKWAMLRMALELNFVNHVLPSGGAAGFSYLGWLLSKYGVSGGRAAMAQIIRYVITFIGFVAILCLALVVLTLDNNVNRITLLMSGIIVVVSVGFTFGIIYMLGSRKRLEEFATWLTKTVNGLVRKITRGKKLNILKQEKVDIFFLEVHDDYLKIRQDKKLLKKPFLWSLLLNSIDGMILTVAFLALGIWVSPAVLFVGFGVSWIASVLSVTPGGAGIYEAVMIAFLVSSGVPTEAAIAGTLLARIILLLVTIIFGYVFYQMTILKYGKKPV